MTKISPSFKKISVCIVSPFPPPLGGMAIQAENLVELLRKEGYWVIPVKTNIDFPRSIRTVENISVFRTVLRLPFFLAALHKAMHHSDVIYFLTSFHNFFMWVTYPALILIKMRGKRVILSARGGGAADFFRKYGPIVRPILKKVDVITTPSDFLKEIFESFFQLKAIVIPNVLNLDQFSFTEKTCFRPFFLSTRNLEKIYDVEGVINAFHIIHERHPEARLGIVGDGSLRKSLEEKVRSWALQDSVRFYGAVKHEEIQKIYSEYDIFLNASSVDNLPGTILEAFAAGLPVVSTNAGGIPYLVAEGETGLLVGIGDYKGLAENGLQIIDKPDLGRRLAGNARNFCTKYSWPRIKTQILPLIETIGK